MLFVYFKSTIMILFSLPKVNSAPKLPGINNCAVALFVFSLLTLTPSFASAFDITNKFQNPVVFPLKGKITGADNEPLSGVSITVKGSNISTSTDARGNFSLNLPNGNATLELTHVGFLSKEVPVNNQLQLDVSLQKMQLRCRRRLS